MNNLNFNLEQSSGLKRKADIDIDELNDLLIESKEYWNENQNDGIPQELEEDEHGGDDEVEKWKKLFQQAASDVDEKEELIEEQLQ